MAIDKKKTDDIHVERISDSAVRKKAGSLTVENLKNGLRP